MIGDTRRIERNPCLLAVEMGRVACCARPLEALGPEEIRVRTEVSMVSSGTELHHIQGTHTKKVQFPLAMGYISVGRVIGMGDQVTGIEIGQRVLVPEPHFAYHNAHFRSARPVPEGVEPVDACCTILLGVGLRGVRGGTVRFADSVAVFGLGVIGQFAVHLAKLSGAFPVMAIDPVARRRDVARQMGADLVIDPSRSDVREQIAAATGNELARVSIDASGTPKVIAGLADLTAAFGRVVVLGGVHGAVPMDLYTNFQKRNLTMIGCGSAYPTDFPYDEERNERSLLAMIQAGMVRPRPVVTHVVPWTEGGTMYDLLMNDKDQAIGVAFDWSKL